ncbi:metal ABC transporter ATP-binding protein [Clostridiaceae bacterium 35-E11]
MDKVVELKGVSFGYDEKLVLQDIQLDIYEKDYLGIVGPNGAAKSTLIKLMLGILTPEKGSIKLFHQNIKDFKEWGKIGYVAQKATSFNTSFPATVEEVITANLFSEIGLFRPIGKKHLEKVERVLSIVGMENFKNRLIGNLSGGQQQKVFIARTLVSSPKIIFLDEPTVGIDAKSQEQFYQLMKKLNQEMDITIVMISHDIGAVTENVNRVACMGDKRLVTHHPSSKIPFHEILSEFYGEKMKLLIHHHKVKLNSDGVFTPPEL